MERLVEGQKSYKCIKCKHGKTFFLGGHDVQQETIQMEESSHGVENVQVTQRRKGLSTEKVCSKRQKKRNAADVFGKRSSALCFKHEECLIDGALATITNLEYSIVELNTTKIIMFGISAALYDLC